MGPDLGHAGPAGQPQSPGGKSLHPPFNMFTCPKATYAMACNIFSVSFSDK